MNDERQNSLIPPTLGETLRLEREKRGLGLDALAAELRVRAAVLSAIESDDTAHIPRVYLRGYVRNYAQRLGIDPADIEGRIGQVPAVEPAVQSVFSQRLPRDRSERWFKATSYVLASGLVIALAWQFTAEAVRFSQGDPRPRAGAEDGVADTAPASTADAERAASPADQPDRPDAAKSHLRASIASMQPARISKQGRSVAENAWAAVGSRGTGDEALPASGGAALTISTSADSWVEIVDGTGERIEMDLFRAGTERRYDGVAPFRLLLGRASSIELSYRGEPVDLGPHTRGNVARVTLGGGPEPAEATSAPQATVPEAADALPAAPADDDSTPDQG